MEKLSLLAPANSGDEPGSSASDSSRVAATARRLAIQYSDEFDIPTKYRGKLTERTIKRATKKDAAIQERFNRNVSAWAGTIEAMLARLEAESAWRLVECAPEVRPGTDSVTGCTDFNDSLDYLIRRRDSEGCGPDELGCLCTLITSFQRSIEATIAAG